MRTRATHSLLALAHLAPMLLCACRAVLSITARSAARAATPVVITHVPSSPKSRGSPSRPPSAGPGVHEVSGDANSLADPGRAARFSEEPEARHGSASASGRAGGRESSSRERDDDEKWPRRGPALSPPRPERQQDREDRALGHAGEQGGGWARPRELSTASPEVLALPSDIERRLWKTPRPPPNDWQVCCLY